MEDSTSLWEVYNKDYLDKDKRKRAVKDMEETIGLSAANIKGKIHILRSQLGTGMATVAKKKSEQGADELYKPTWIDLDRLQFLCTVVQPGKSKGRWKGGNEEQI